MGWVEIVETLKRIGAVEMPRGVKVYFSTRLNGLTYGGPCVCVQGRGGHFDWHIERVPTEEDIVSWRLSVDRFLAAGGR